jgi:SAM-dependent methyltransferase
MPTSDYRNIPEIIRLVHEQYPYNQSILDIGVGYGKYGALLREYLDVFGHHENFGSRSHVIDGIEACGRYIQEHQRAIYDNITIGDARDIVPRFPSRLYDVILLLDVLEHFSKEDGLKLLKECARVGLTTIIATPAEFGEQGAVYENEYERHLSVWTTTEICEAFAPLSCGIEGLGIAGGIIVVSNPTTVLNRTNKR